jgi:hypothetical protein
MKRANAMHARTAFRLAVLTNGYWPVLNECKESVVTGWQKKRPDRTEVLSWDRSALLSTGMKIDGDLAVIDADIREATLINALAGAFDERYPELFARGLVRHAGGVKEAWFVRTEKPFRQIHSRKWCRGDPKDPKCRSIMSNVLARSERGSSESMGRMRATSEARSSTRTNSPAELRRRRRRGCPCPRCRRRPLRRLATCSMRSLRRPD